MSECVVRMEMPINNCPIAYRSGGQAYCPIERKRCEFSDPIGSVIERPNWCPILCELPEGWDEIWKPISGYDGKYWVSNKGNIKSNYGMMIPRERKNGYMQICLTKGGKHHTHMVHRLVAEHFVDNPNKRDFLYINHKDENKKNNRADNLEWCTAKYNSNYGSLPERRKNRRYVPVVCLETCETYPSMSEASRREGVSLHVVMDSCEGITKHPTAGKTFRYAVAERSET